MKNYRQHLNHLNESSKGEKLEFNGSTFEDVTEFIYNNYPQHVDMLNRKLVTFRSNDLNIQGDLKRNREWEIQQVHGQTLKNMQHYNLKVR